MGDYIYEVVHTEPDIPVRCFSYTSTMAKIVPAHWHDDLEVIRVECGRMTVTFGKEQMILKEGDWLLINSRDIHRTVCEAGSVIEVLQIPFPLLKRYIPKLDGKRLADVPQCLGSGLPKSEEVGEVLHHLAVLCEGREDGYVLDFHAYFFRLLGLFYRYYIQPVSESSPVQKEENRKRMTAVMDYVNRNYKDKITLEEAARLVSLNKEYFCRVFRRYMGMSFMEYVHEIRFYHVCEDLFATEERVMILLEEHGFTNYKLFMKMFHQRYQGTPAKIRGQGK